jgi:hypothetical protein
MQTIINRGKRSVSIFSNDETGGRFSARLFVNCTGPKASELGDATSLSKTFKSRSGAERWAEKTLSLYA